MARAGLGDDKLPVAEGLQAGLGDHSKVLAGEKPSAPDVLGCAGAGED